MLDSKMLLICTDPSLIKTVQRVTSSINNLHLGVISEIDAACSHLEDPELGLFIVHITHESNISEVTRLLRSIAATGLPIPLLILSDHYQADQALSLLRLGAVDYLSRPLDLRRLAYLVDVLTVRARCVGVGGRHSSDALPEPTPVQTLGEQEPFLYYPYADMGRMMDQVRTVAPQDTTVLLSGETGTGKTHLARLIHELSPRSDQPFLVINCGALSSGLIESEMFGHVKGAFTGADRDRVGKFSEVARGTLLLDEIDALPLALQAKLLRAVEERIFEPVGSNKSQTIRARLIAASNRSLDQEAAEGRFRSDLYYRLNVVGFTLPPLRHRPWTIAPLANQYIGEFSARNGRDVRGMTAEVLRLLEAYAWPGNVRELRNVIERAVALCPAPEIQADDLPAAIRPQSGNPTATATPQAAEPSTHSPELSRPPGNRSTLTATKEEAEIARITEALEKHGNNRLRAAAELGISRMTLYKKLRKYNLFGMG
ncbi:MAG TPA: sigma-54 dependent transcriptional regulator [Isosphaeraceae bacterium]|jgi:two-component system response regulator PilR (NtrC family)|nr:sigma-54 dependent transcriptional regulator [Isosphaeraceae bacterium]